MLASVRDANASGAARRRQRRLRQWLRHERLSVAMALAENNHHTARVPEDALRQAAGPRHFAMDAGEDVGEAPAAGRPAPLLEVLPQERVQRCTVEQIVDPAPSVPLLHDDVPQMVEQLVDILSPLDFRVAEQVIEVPRIVCPPRAARTVLRAPQTVGSGSLPLAHSPLHTKVTRGVRPCSTNPKPHPIRRHWFVVTQKDDQEK